MTSLARTHDDPETGTKALWFVASDWVPNNLRLPVLFYPGAIDSASSDPAAACEAMFQRNGWPPQWRNSVYPFHHYHSTAHEVLGIAEGNARVLLGGPGGVAVDATAGDCVLLPAGTGHCRLAASRDLLVVGAYPPGATWDLKREALSAAALEAMARLPIPATDPIMGRAGGLVEFWSQVR